MSDHKLSNAMLAKALTPGEKPPTSAIAATLKELKAMTEDDREQLHTWADADDTIAAPASA